MKNNTIITNNIVFLSTLLASLLNADSNVGQQIMDLYERQMTVSKFDHAKALDVNQIVINSTLRYYLPKDMRDHRMNLEKVCIANGGNVYSQKVNRFEESVEVAAYDNEKINAISPEEKKVIIGFDNKEIGAFGKKEESYLEALFSKERENAKGDDVFWELDTYHTTCKDLKTGMMIYKTEGYYDSIKVTLSNVNTLPPKKLKAVTPIEEVLSYFVDGREGDKFILKRKLALSPKYYITDMPSMVQKQCEGGGGDLYVGTGGAEQKRYEFASPLTTRDTNGYIGCNMPGNTYTITRKPGRDEDVWILTKMDTLPAETFSKVSKQPSQPAASQNNKDPFAQSAIFASGLPVGADSENNIGNIKTVSTVYDDTGSYKLVSVREIGGNNTFKNYRVSNGSSEDITSKYVSFNTIKMPQSVISAKTPLAKQCVLYGAANASIDGYTVSCTRQSFGSNCSANMVFMKGDQFITKESMTCN